MKRPYQTFEDASISDTESVKDHIDKKHLYKVIDDIFYSFDLRNKDYGEILLLRDMFEKGYLAAHIEIVRDDMRDKYPECFNKPYYREEE